MMRNAMIDSSGCGAQEIGLPAAVSLSPPPAQRLRFGDGCEIGDWSASCSIVWYDMIWYGMVCYSMV